MTTESTRATAASDDEIEWTYDGGKTWHKSRPDGTFLIPQEADGSLVFYRRVQPSQQHSGNPASTGREPDKLWTAEAEARQRVALDKLFASRATTPATADFDLPAPNDAVAAPELDVEAERREFEAYAREVCEMPEGVPVNWNATWTRDSWEVWLARARRAATDK